MYLILKNGRDFMIDGKPMVVGTERLARKIVQMSNQAMASVGVSTLYSYKDIRDDKDKSKLPQSIENIDKY